MFLTSKHGGAATDKLFKDMEDIIIRSLFSVQRSMINDKHCFELYGYDMLFDDDLKPWLIEVNASPSVSSTRSTLCTSVVLRQLLLHTILVHAAHSEHS